MHPLLWHYRSLGYDTNEQVLEAARCRGIPAWLDVVRAISEDATMQNSTAMVVVPAEPPGKNVCDFIRKMIGGRTKLIVAAQPGKLAPGNFEKLLRASMPDCEKKIRVMDVGDSLADAVSSAERNRHYRPSQALEVYCDDQDARNFAQEIRDGSLKFDPTVISVRQTEVPTDDLDAILKAVQGEDLAAMHRVLDPHLFSDQNALGSYKDALFGQGEGLFTVGGESTTPPKKESVLREQLVTCSGCDSQFDTATASKDGTGSVSCPECGTGTPDADHNDTVKLGSVQWKRKRLAGYTEGFVWRKLVGNIDCSVLIAPMTEWSMVTRRGKPSNKFIVDVELTNNAVSAIIYHVEKTFVDEPQADVFADRIMNFIDSKTATELSKEKRASGGQELSKFNESQRLQREFLTDIAATRELGIAKLDAILKAELGNHFDELEYLGSGRNGSAYRTPDGLILKVTTDSTEVYSAEKLRGIECEYIHRIHTVSQIAENVWVILQEGGLEKLPHSYAEEFDLAMEILETIGAGHHLRSGNAIGVKEVMISSGHRDLCELVAEVMKKFGVGGMLREVYELGLSADFHSGNIMLREGRPVLTDLGTAGDDPNDDKNGPPGDGMQVSELAGPQVGPLQMRGSNSSAWAGGRMVLSNPEQHVPEDENETEGDRGLDKDMRGGGLDWGKRGIGF